MLRKKPFLKIFLLFTITLAGLLLVYPSLRNTYRDFLITTGNSFLGHPGKQASVKFLENNEEKYLDMTMYIGNSFKMETEPNAVFWITKASTMYLSWIPLALMIALVIASPVRLLKKLIIFISGIIIVHIITYIKLLIQIYYVANTHRDLDILLLSPFWFKVNSLLLDNFVDTVQPSLVLIFIIWMLMTFTYKDYNKLMGLTKLTTKRKSRGDFT